MWSSKPRAITEGYKMYVPISYRVSQKICHITKYIYQGVGVLSGKVIVLKVVEIGWNFYDELRVWKPNNSNPSEKWQISKICKKGTNSRPIFKILTDPGSFLQGGL